MNTIKSLIIATAIASALSPVTSVCAMAADTDNDNNQENAAAVQVVPMTPEEITEATRIKQFVAKKARHIVIFLPVDLVDIVLGYVKPTNDEVIQANRELLRAQGLDDSLKAITALNEGAYVDTKNIFNGFTSLQNAAMFGQIELVKILLKYNANVNSTNGSLQKTPLHFAALSSHPDCIEIVKILLKNHANVNQQDKDKNTPLIIALARDNATLVELLMIAGATDDRSVFNETV